MIDQSKYVIIFNILIIYIPSVKIIENTLQELFCTFLHIHVIFSSVTSYVVGVVLCTSTVTILRWCICQIYWNSDIIQVASVRLLLLTYS